MSTISEGRTVIIPAKSGKPVGLALASRIIQKYGAFHGTKSPEPPEPIHPATTPLEGQTKESLFPKLKLSARSSNTASSSRGSSRAGTAHGSNDLRPHRSLHHAGSKTDRPSASSQLSSNEEPRQLRFDPNIRLWKLLDVRDLDTGFDWRFLNKEEWLHVKQELMEMGRGGVDPLDGGPSVTSVLEAALGLDSTDPLNSTGPSMMTTTSMSSTSQTVKHPSRIWRNLTSCIVAGTRQASVRDCYPLGFDPKCSSASASAGRHRALQIQWVDISKLRRRLFRMNFFGMTVPKLMPGNSLSIEVKEDDGEHLPVIVCAMSAPDAAILVSNHFKQNLARSKSQEKPPNLVVTLDADPDAIDAVQSERPGILLDAEGSMESFLMRSDMEVWIQEAGKRFAITSPTPMSKHLSAREDPFILYCEDAVLFREGAKDAYAFMQEPIVYDLVLFSMAIQRPQLAKRIAPPSRFSGRLPEKDYTSEVDQRALLQRLTLIANKVLRVHEEHSERQHKKPPILIISLPGCLGNQRHPVAGVAAILQKLRESHVGKFTAIVVACGEDRDISTQVDSIVNKDLVETPVDMTQALEKLGWPDDHKSLFMSMSVNQGSVMAMTDLEGMKKRRNTWLDHMHAKEHLKTLEDALVTGVSGVRALHTTDVTPAGSKITQLILEERKKKKETEEKHQMAKDVQRLAEEFIKGSGRWGRTNARPTLASRHGTSNIWCLSDSL